MHGVAPFKFDEEDIRQALDLRASPDGREALARTKVVPACRLNKDFT
jgi:hypothetical protein